MKSEFRVPILGAVPSLNLGLIPDRDSNPDLVISSWAPYTRFAVEIADDGLHSFGLRLGGYAIFKEQRWPERECSVCLISIGDEYTMRLVEGVRDTVVRLRVGGDVIEPVEMMDHEFVVMGVLDGIVLPEDVRLEQQKELQFDWRC